MMGALLLSAYESVSASQTHFLLNVSKFYLKAAAVPSDLKMRKQTIHFCIRNSTFMGIGSNY